MEAKYKGIDVSKWQGDINWEKVRASGVEFAMLRAGFGRCQGQNDTSFERNYREAKKNGILVGAYHYSYAKTVSDAEKEAEYFLSLISGKSFEFPVAFDIEDNSQKNLSREEISNIVEAFCGRTEKAGYFVSVYANLWWLNNKISDRVKERYDIWLAQWADAPSYGGKYGMWQYTSSGKTDGITGNTDMDLAFKDYPNIMRANGLNGFSKGAAESTDNVKSGTFPPSRSVALCNTPLFSSAYSKAPSARKSGTYYIYDGIEINGRYRITSSASFALKKPIGKNVTGFVNADDIR